MTNNENMERKNSMVETEDEKDNAAVIGIALTEPDDTMNESSQCEVNENAEFNEDSSAAEIVVPANIADETADDAVNEKSKTEETANEKMSYKEITVLVIIGILLALLLIWLGVRAINGSLKSDIDRKDATDSSYISEETTGAADNGNDTVADNIGKNEFSDSDSYGDTNGATTGTPGASGTSTGNNGGNGNGNSNSANTDPNNQSPSTTAPNNGNSGNGSGDNSNGNGNGTQPPATTEKDSNTDNNGGNNGINGDNNNQTDKNDDAAPDYTGDTKIRITKVSDDTGVITISVGDEKLAVPVQTTLFNGRVTKSGVAQGKLFGYNCGATVMLFYPQADGMGETDYNGYMSRTGDSLTILVDINGENSKLLIKINGFKSL